MESQELDKIVTKDGLEKTYRVELRSPVVNYFRNGLSNTYKTEQQKIQEGGDYQQLLEFNNSRLGKLMTKLSTIEDEPENQSVKMYLDLSQEELSIMTGDTSSPESLDYIGRTIRREMVEELKGNFQSAKTSAVIGEHVAKVKGFFRRGK